MDGRPLKWAGWIFGSIGLVLGALFVTLALVSSHGEQGKSETTGTVIDRYVSDRRSRNSDGTWEDHSTTWVVIEYEVDSNTYTFRQSFPRQVGDTVTVVYDAAHPDEGEVAGSGAFVFWLLAGALGLPFTVIGFGLWLWGRSHGTSWANLQPVKLDSSWRWGTNPLAAGRDDPTTLRLADDSDGEFPAYPGSSMDSRSESDARDLR